MCIRVVYVIFMQVLHPGMPLLSAVGVQENILQRSDWNWNLI